MILSGWRRLSSFQREGVFSLLDEISDAKKIRNHPGESPRPSGRSSWPSAPSSGRDPQKHHNSFSTNRLRAPRPISPPSRHVSISLLPRSSVAFLFRAEARARQGGTHNNGGSASTSSNTLSYNKLGRSRGCFGTSFRNLNSSCRNSDQACRSFGRAFRNLDSSYRNSDQACRSFGRAFRNLDSSYRNSGQAFRNSVLSFRNSDRPCRNSVLSFRNSVRACQNFGKAFRNSVSSCRSFGKACRNLAWPGRHSARRSFVIACSKVGRTPRAECLCWAPRPGPRIGWLVEPGGPTGVSSGFTSSASVASAESEICRKTGCNAHPSGRSDRVCCIVERYWRKAARPCSVSRIMVHGFLPRNRFSTST